MSSTPSTANAISSSSTSTSTSNRQTQGQWAFSREPLAIGKSEKKN